MQATLFQVYLSAMHFFICAPCLAFLVFYCFHHNYYCLVSARLVLSKCLVVILTNLSHLYLQLPLLVLHGPYLSQQTPMKIIKMYTALFCPFSVSELIIGNYNFVTCKVLFPYVLSVSVDHQVGFLGEGKTEVCEEHSLGAKEKAPNSTHIWHHLSDSYLHHFMHEFSHHCSRLAPSILNRTLAYCLINHTRQFKLT